MKSSLLCGIDIGNSAIKTVIAEMNHETQQPRIIGVGSIASNGLRRGMVVDMTEAIESVKESVQQAELMAGNKVTQAYVSINGLHIKTQLSRESLPYHARTMKSFNLTLFRLIEVLPRSACR